MLDLYQVLVPVYAIITLATLIYLKLAVRDNAMSLEITERNIKCEREDAKNDDVGPVRKSLRFLMQNFTLMQFCAVGRGKYKLSLLLSVSLVSLAAFYTNSPFYFCFIGSVVYFGYLLATMAAVGVSNEKEEDIKLNRQKYFQVLYGILSVSINFILIGLIFKNYRNSELKGFISNAAINIALDNFVVRPVFIIIFGTFLSRSQAYMQYIEQEEINVKLIEFYEKIKGKQSLTKPIGKMYSPSKIPKCVPVNLEIQPVPIEREVSKIDQSDPSENMSKELNPLKMPQLQNLQRSLQLLRKLKKEKSAPPMLTTPMRHNRFEDSQNSLLNSTNKQHSSPAKSKRYEHQDDPMHNSEKVIELSDQMPSNYKQRKFGSENVIMINPSRQQPVENEEDEQTNDQLLKRKITEGSIEEEHFDFTKKATINLEDEINNPLKISLNNSSGPSSRNQPLRICLNGEEHHFANEENEEEIQSDRFRRRRDTINPDETPVKNTLGVLEIKEQHHCEEIQQLDLNSPQRRRQATKKEEEISRLQIKKKKKKLSHDERNRVIRFTTGQPYLEYLPNMLNKEGSKKKMQAKKELIIDSRLGKKPKRKDFNFQNNENIVPSFRIEDY